MPRHAGPSSEREVAPAGNSWMITAELTVVRCRWCNDELEHCHDSLIVHHLGAAECMNALCVVPTEAHHIAVDCSDIGCTCVLTAATAQAVS
jgi:hypothetical protein